MTEGAAYYARRYAKACDACHRKKIRCVYSEPACQLCRKTGEKCNFTRIEKTVPKKPRRGKHLAALEERMKMMEGLLRQSKTGSPEDAGQPSVSVDEAGVGDGAFAAIVDGEAYPSPKQWERMRTLSDTFEWPTHEEALRLAQGYFASHNHTFPMFSRKRFMERMQEDYPPRKSDDFVWWTAVLVVLTFAYRLRAMSTPTVADADNRRACSLFVHIFDAIPKLTYMKPSLEAAQVLLTTATLMRGSAMPDHVPMLTAAAIRMLQCDNVHIDEEPDTPEFARRAERIHTFWAAYIMDKDISLQFRKPPVLHEQDIGRMAASPELLQEGFVRSLDSYREANLFVISQKLAMLQGQVWSLIYAGMMAKTKPALEAAQNVLNPKLTEWKESLPFRFSRDDLVGKWPKHAIVSIVILHFRYFNTLVELNKEPPMEPSNGLNTDCPLAKSLPEWPHSTSPLAVQAARDALDLAALTPRGNFQNVWMFFNYSLSAMLTLLVNGIVRPIDPHNTEDLHRVNTWLRVIDILATESERPDLLRKKEFIMHMRGWTVYTIQAAHNPHMSLSDPYSACWLQIQENTRAAAELAVEDDWLPDLADVHADIFPLPMVSQEVWQPWSAPSHVGAA